MRSKPPQKKEKEKERKMKKVNYKKKIFVELEKNVTGGKRMIIQNRIPK